MTLKDLYQRPGFLLRRTHQISAAVFENACASVGLTPAQYGVLTVLSSEPGLDQTRLARALAFDKVTVMRVCKGLEERGLIERRIAEIFGRLGYELADGPADRSYGLAVARLAGVPAPVVARAKAVLEKHLPALIGNPQMEMARSMTLKQIQGFAGDALSDEILAKVDADLAANRAGLRPRRLERSAGEQR